VCGMPIFGPLRAPPGSAPRSVSDTLAPAVKIAVVLPAYNEENNLTPLITELVEVARRGALSMLMIVVDDGSTDGTAAELTALRNRVPCLRVVTHCVNRGLAQALKSGIAAVRESGCDAAVFMDSDLSHRPDDLGRLVSALTDGADVALGSRFVPGGGMEGVPLWRRAISRMGNQFGRRVLGVTLTDLTTGYKAMRIQVLDALVLEEDGFTIQLEAVVKAAAAGFRIVEVPIVLGTRKHGSSHMTYTTRLLVDYWRLLTKCRRWLRPPSP
jgi:dolichol-phosphate mannosyltransferase